MPKLLIYSKFLVFILLCFSLAGTNLSGENAMAAEESDQLLKMAGELLQNAAAATSRAKETGDITLAEAALAQTKTAAGLILRTASIAQEAGNAELALVALNLTGPTSTVISDVLIAARDAANSELVSAALEIVELTSVLISNIATMAQETGNPPLAQAALGTADNSRTMIAQVSETARFIAQTSTDTTTVEATEEIINRTETAFNLITQATSTFLAAGAIPEATEAYEAPPGAPSTQEQPIDQTGPAFEVPPIQDDESASPV